MGADFRAFVEIVFQNNEDTVQSWHLDGYSFFVLGMDGGWADSSPLAATAGAALPETPRICYLESLFEGVVRLHGSYQADSA
jgi:hypothetical protein